MSTVLAPLNNTLVRQALEEPGEGRVLIVDGLGVRRVALLGDQLGARAVDNGWAGDVAHGAVRDVRVLRGPPA